LFHDARFGAITGGRPVYGVAVNRGVDGGGNRRAELLRQMSEQPRRSSKQRHPAKQLGWQANVGERSAPHPCAIERERAAKYLRMYSANRLEEPQMWPAQPLAPAMAMITGVRGSLVL
jgi:hypothetical protein